MSVRCHNSFFFLFSKFNTSTIIIPHSAVQNLNISARMMRKHTTNENEEEQQNNNKNTVKTQLNALASLLTNNITDYQSSQNSQQCVLLGEDTHWRPHHTLRQCNRVRPDHQLRVLYDHLQD